MSPEVVVEADDIPSLVRPSAMASSAVERLGRRTRVEAFASVQDGVVSRSQLYRAGFSRGEVRANIRAGRWRALGRHCVVMHTGGLAKQAAYWAAVLEAGPRAHVDGASALLLAGLERFEVERIRVTVPRGARIRHRGSGVDIRQTRRWNPADVIANGVPRTRPQVAAIRAALWARSSRQASLILTMVVQQRLASVEELAEEMLRIRRDKRRALVHALLVDLAGGVRSLNELDVVRGCRERLLPEPDKQVLRRTPGGTYYLDLRWDRWSVVVEVDGIQHAWVENAVADAARHNEIAMSRDLVLRLPVLGLRVCPEVFFEHIRRALESSGWSAASAA